MHHYILVTGDSFGIGSALEIARDRLESRKWPLYRNTRNRKQIREGDKVAIYIAGSGDASRHIVATAVVEDVVELARPRQLDSEDYITDLAYREIVLREIVWITPVNLALMMPKLSICPQNPKNWGGVLVGGCRKVTEADWELLISP